MKIDIERLVKVNNSQSSKLKAVVDLRLENCFILEDIKLIEHNGKLFIAMKSRKTSTGEYKDIYHPIDESLRDLMSRVIIEEYQYGRYSSGYSEGLNITEVKIKKIPDSPNGLIAVASIVFNNKLVVHDIKLVQKKSEDGAVHHLVIMPNREINGQFRNIAYAINDNLRSQISEKVLEEYEKLN